MKVAAIYDIHGNLPALEAVLDEIHRAAPDRIVVGGDVLPGPMPEACLALLRDVDIPLDCIRGNGDRETLAHLEESAQSALPEAFREILHWTARRLTPEDRAWVASWPATLQVQLPHLGDVLFCHATPRNDTDIFTLQTVAQRLEPVFEGVQAGLVVCGHTHMQFDRRVGGTRVVNAGSVGMPYGEPGAYWLWLEPDVELRCTAYDRHAAARTIAATAFPGAPDFAERYVLNPPTEADGLALFAKAEL